MKICLIAGIDPGTTVGWALLNLKGEIVAVGSQKELDLDSLIAKFTEFGKVIIVGSDKSKVPSFVQETATKLGAKFVGPAQDVRVNEKRLLTVPYSFNNSHEMDALASALLAFRKVQPLLRKIRALLEKEQKLGLLEEVFELVLKEEISIRAAFVLLTPVDEKKEYATFEEQKQDDDVIHLFNMLSRARKDNAVLVKRNRELELKVFGLEQELFKLRERTSNLVKPKTPGEIARLKDSQINSLSQRLKNSLQTQSKLSNLIEKLERILLQQDKIPLVRLPHLGWDDVMKNKELITEGSVLFVDDANEMSDKAVEWLRQKNIQIIVCGKLPGHRARQLLPFACVPAEDCELLNKISLVKRAWLDKIRSERSVLSKIVEDYKKVRSSV